MNTFRKILVPLDGSELAERSLGPAVNIAEAMARQSSAEESSDHPVKLVLLRATTGPTLATADPFVYDSMMTAYLDESREYLEKTAGTLSSSAVQVETRSVPGPAAEAIVNFAEEDGTDLIVLSSHGRTGGSRWVYGSVAEKVLHHAPCAVAVVRAQATHDLAPNAAMLVPLDGSELAEKALAPAMVLAGGLGSDVILLRVVSSPDPVAEGLVNRGAPSPEQRMAVEQEERAEAQAYLQIAAADLASDHVNFDVSVATGEVADAIVDYAAAHNVGLIVMSSHGRSGISRWLHGSVAEKVLRGADCATMIVRSTGG